MSRGELRQVEKLVSKKFMKQAVKQKQQHERILRKANIANKKRIQLLFLRHKSEKRLWKKKQREELARRNAQFEREFGRIKKNYQMQAEQIRCIYRDQHALAISEMRSLYDGRVEEITKTYSAAAAANSEQLTKLQHWLQEELVTQLLEKKHQLSNAEAEQVRLAAELRIGKLKEQLDQRESQIIASTERMQRLEEKVAGRYARALWSKLRGSNQPVSETPAEEDTEHDKLMKIVNDISREKAELEGDRHGSDDDAVSSLIQTWNSDRPRRSD